MSNESQQTDATVLMMVDVAGLALTGSGLTGHGRVRTLKGRWG